MQFLQPTHSEVYANAVPTHKLSGSEQLNPFGRSLRGAVATKTHEPKQQARQARWTKPRDCLRLLLCSFLGFEPKATIQLDCNNYLNVQDPKIFLSKKNFLSLLKDRQQRHCGRFCPPQTTSTHLVISPWWRVRGLLSSLRDIGNYRLDVNLSTNKTQPHVDYSQLHIQLLTSSHSKLSLVQSSKFKSVRHSAETFYESFP